MGDGLSARWTTHTPHCILYGPRANARTTQDIPQGLVSAARRVATLPPGWHCTLSSICWHLRTFSMPFAGFRVHDEPFITANCVFGSLLPSNDRLTRSDRCMAAVASQPCQLSPPKRGPSACPYSITVLNRPRKRRKWRPGVRVPAPPVSASAAGGSGGRGRPAGSRSQSDAPGSELSGLGNSMSYDQCGTDRARRAAEGPPWQRLKGGIDALLGRTLYTWVHACLCARGVLCMWVHVPVPAGMLCGASFVAAQPIWV